MHTQVLGKWILIGSKENPQAECPPASLLGSEVAHRSVSGYAAPGTVRIQGRSFLLFSVCLFTLALALVFTKYI